MNEERLWQALADHPHDEMAWHAYADCLEEVGRPEAEFVRLFLSLLATVPDEAFRAAWKRLRQLRRTLPEAWRADFTRRWRARPVRMRISEVHRLGHHPPQELFDRVLTLLTVTLVSGTVRVGQWVVLPLADGGTARERIWAVDTFARTQESLTAGDWLRDFALVWSGHRVADLGVAIGGWIHDDMSQ